MSGEEDDGGSHVKPEEASSEVNYQQSKDGQDSIPTIRIDGEGEESELNGASITDDEPAPLVAGSPTEHADNDESSRQSTPVEGDEAEKHVASVVPDQQHETTTNGEADDSPVAESASDLTSQPESKNDIPGVTASAMVSTPPSRARSPSRSTVGSRQTPVASTVFVTTALESIGQSREAKRSKEFLDAIQAALSNIKDPDKSVDPEIMFKPLDFAAKSLSTPLQVTALDCIGKLISYSYFAFPSAPADTEGSAPATTPLIERAIETICDCFENEATAVEVQQQIVKSLLAAVLNDKIVVHGAGLLKAVRQIYNIFIYSRSSQNQQVAQGSLTQMVATVFDRVKTRLDLKEVRLREEGALRGNESIDNESSILEQVEMNGVDTPQEQSSSLESLPVRQEKMTLQSFETNKNLDDAVVAENAPTTITRARNERHGERSNSGPVGRSSLHTEREANDVDREEDEDDVYIKDAFLVFRSLCKLSQKALTHEQQQDLKSQNMRSKLLSLHLIHHLLNNHTLVFISPLSTLRSGAGEENTPFMQVAKPHLCLSLSRNASSSVSRVYDVCCEIFWLSLKYMRVTMKKEIEVFMKEIYLAVLEKRSAPFFQKQMFMDVLERLSRDPRALVEIYLNYDCDRTALDNMYQLIIEYLARICSTQVVVTANQQQQYMEQREVPATPGSEWHAKGSLLPGLSTASISHYVPPTPTIVPIEYVLKQQSLQCLIDILNSLDNWSSQLTADGQSVGRYPGLSGSYENSRESLDNPNLPPPSPRILSGQQDNGTSTPIIDDDPSEIEKVRQRKSALNEAIHQFNFKAKRGIKALIADGFIPSSSPEDIARFLLTNDRLDKAQLGEYLGEGDDNNIAIMHAFVDSMDFAKRRFVDALRQFLQSFRLPGEAQKIDRFMLKFAERYLTGNPNAFANADTAYVLSYSVIMLNTDQHSVKVKKRMTPEDFIKNNRGINDGQDLPIEYLTGIYDEIASNEIVLSSEREHAADLGIVAAPPTGLASRAGKVLANVGRDLEKEKYAQASEEMANKTEQLYRSLIRAQKRSVVRDALSRFIPASSIKHVGPMFNVTWMSFLSSISGQMQDAQNLGLIRQCLEGLRLAIRISCRFDLETPRTAFVTALAKFTSLGNLREMMAKNLEALKILIDVALSEGDVLRSSWREILTCISQLDRFQLLSGGVDEGVLPDLTKSHIPSPANAGESGKLRKSMQTAVRRPKPRTKNSSTTYRPEVADETRSSDMVRDVDRIFVNTEKLSSEAIVDFVRALSEVSWQEIQSSGQSEAPRLYSLQKLVDISYYNMSRVRIEWTRIWEVLGEYFIQVGAQANEAVVHTALDSLRQLSMRFLDIEELPGFKFQKDFLKPFAHILANNSLVSVKDLVMRCLIQMIQAKSDNIRSGWKTIFEVFTVAAGEQHEAIVNIAFDYTNQIYNTRFGLIISQGAFPDLIVCLTEFSKNLRFQKKSLSAIELLKSTVPKMLKTPECPLSWRHGRRGLAETNGITPGVKQPTSQTEEEQFWYPVLLAYQDVLMTGEDLEVRSQALTYLFDTLKRYGGDFPVEFWDVLWRQVLYPIFIVLQSKSEMAKAPNHEELSVWLSTTMIQALRHMIALFTHYFESLEHMLDRFLDLLALCICQENDTIARIGSNCLQQLILQNVSKFNPDHWTKIVGAFVDLFNRTTAYELFSAAATMSDARPNSVLEPSQPSLALSSAENHDQPMANGTRPISHTPTASTESATEAIQSPHLSNQTPHELEDYRPQTDLHAQAPVVTAARRRFFNRIITNCVLQLLMIETVNELFSNDSVYAQIPSAELLRLMGLLKKSYQFAKKFNADKDLRMQLWRQGFMKQPPNLLKQESGSANTYVSILLRMYHDEGEERRSNREETEKALIPLCADIIRSYTQLDDESQQRNLVAWRPVVVDVLEGYANFPRSAFDKHIETFYPLAVGLLEKEMPPEMRGALWGLFRRVGEVRLGMAELEVRTPGPTPTSPGSAVGGEGKRFDWSRRSSRASHK